MFCKNCGNKLSENTAFCGSCGKAIGVNTPPPPKRKINPVLIIVVVLAVVVVGLVVRSTTSPSIAGHWVRVETSRTFTNDWDPLTTASELEFFENGTGIRDSRDSFNWTSERGRISVHTIFWSPGANDYEISGSRLTIFCRGGIHYSVFRRVE